MKSIVTVTVRIAILTGILVFGDAIAYEGERLKQNVGQDYANCASFYAISSEMYRRNNDIEGERQFHNLSTKSIEMGLVVFSQKELEAKIELALGQMKTVVREQSFSRLIIDFGQLCKDIMEKPQQRILYWKDMN